MLGRAAAEDILHGLLATLTVVLILRGGRVRDPRSRLHFWLIGLACPVVLSPLFWWLAPVRFDESFRDGWALFAGDRLAPLTLRGHSLARLAALVLGAAGLLLYLRDLVPFLLDFGRSRARAEIPEAIPEIFAQTVGRIAAVMRCPVPRLRVLPSRHPILICRGLRRPLVVTSRGLLDRLAGDELDAAVAHELAHARYHDPACGWLLMLVRGLCCFNPAVQLCARAITQEVERRADLDAAQALGDPEPVARSLRRLAGDDGRGGAAAPTRAWHGFRQAAMRERCRLLLDESPAAPAPTLALATTAIGLGVILFLTVA